MSATAGDPSAVTRIQHLKADLRRALLTARARRASDAGADRERCAALLALPEIACARTVAAYAALPGEPDLGGVLASLQDRHVRVLLPAVVAARDLVFRQASGELVRGELGILTPRPDAPLIALEEADVVLVPAVAADRAGHRLGRGGGSYDRVLHRVAPEALVIAVVHPEELLAHVPVEPHDHPVRAVLAGTSLLRIDARPNLPNFPE